MAVLRQNAVDLGQRPFVIVGPGVIGDAIGVPGKLRDEVARVGVATIEFGRVLVKFCQSALQFST
jgi:hypothetical protein